MQPILARRVATAVLIAVGTWAVPQAAQAAPFVLTVGSGDGSVTVGVDGFGAFGSSAGVNASNAVFDPPGATGPAGTTFESFLAFQPDASGSRTFLASSEGLLNPAVSGTSTTATSSFSFGGLEFALTQTLTGLFSSGMQIGAQLDQVYTITNPGADLLDFALVRYLDGDLLFNGTLVDGGGRLTDGIETLFETDSATGALDPTTFVGIRAAGGTIPSTGRFEIDAFSGLRSRILAGTALDDIITGDGNADGFIDAGNGYDVTLALNNLFSLGAGQSATYTTTTIFGAGAPGSVPGPGPGPGPGAAVPEPASLVLLGTGLTWLVSRARRRR